MEEENKINPNNENNDDVENSMFSSDDGASMFNETPIETEENIIDVEEVVEKPSEAIEEISEETIEEAVKEENDIENIKETTEKTVEIEPTETIEETSTLNAPANTDNLITVRPVKFEEFKDNNVNRSIKRNLDIMQDIMMHITVEIGKTTSSIKEVMSFKEGSVVELDKVAGEQVEIYANNKLVARGEVIVIEDKFGVRITTTSLPKVEEKD